MAQYPGSIPYTGYVAPADTTDTYPVTHEEFNYGGYRTVVNSTDRLAITMARRKEGMLVKQLDDASYWTLSGGVLDANWSQVIFAMLPNNTTTGIIKVTNGVVSYLATDGSGTRYLREDFTWQTSTGGISGSGTIDNLPKFTSGSGMGDSKFTDDGTTPKYNANTIWHAGISNLSTVDWSAKDLNLYGSLALYGYNGFNGFLTGNGDSASYSTYNFILKGHNGMAFQTYNDDVNGYIDFRAGVIDMVGGFKHNGSTVWDAINSNLPTVDWSAKDLTVTTAKIGVSAIGMSPLSVSYSGIQVYQMTLGSYSGITASFEKLNEGYGLYIGTSGWGHSWIQAGRTNSDTAYDLWLQASGGNLKIGSLSGYLKGTTGVVGAVSSIPESDISFTDITNGDASINQHGYLPKLPNDSVKFLNGIGQWAEVVRPTTTLTYNTSGAWASFSLLTFNGRREGKVNNLNLTFYSSDSSADWQKLGTITNYVSPGYDVYFTPTTRTGLLENSGGRIVTTGDIIIMPGKGGTTYYVQVTWITA